MNKPKWGKYLWQLLIAIIPIPITIWLTVLFVTDPGEVKHLEYTRTVRESFINLPKTLPSKIQLTHDGNPVDNLSSVKYKIFNRTGKSFQDVEIFFEFKPESNASLQLLSKDIKGPENYPEDGFQELKTKSSSTGWSIKVMNSSQNFLDTFEVSFLFLGPTAPDDSIAVLKTGLGLKPLVQSKSSTTYVITSTIAVVVGVLCYVTMIIVFVYLKRSQRSRFINILNDELKEYFKKNEDRLKTCNEVEFADDVLNVYKKTRQKRKDPLQELVISAIKRLKVDRIK